MGVDQKSIGLMFSGIRFGIGVGVHIVHISSLDMPLFVFVFRVVELVPAIAQNRRLKYFSAMDLYGIIDLTLILK